MSDAANTLILCNLQIANATNQSLVPRTPNSNLLSFKFNTILPKSTSLTSIIFSADRSAVSGSDAFYADNFYAFYLQAGTSTNPAQYFLEVSSPPSGGVPVKNIVVAVNGQGTITNAAKASQLQWIAWSGTTGAASKFATLTENGQQFGLALVDLDVLFPDSPAAVEKLFDAIASNKLTSAMKSTLYNSLLEVVTLRGYQWMSQTWNTIKSKPLSSVCLPGSHDSGTAVTTQASIGSTTCNTQTQGLDILGQLNAGVRYFDFRPCYASWKNDFYLTHFRTLPLISGWWGALGQRLLDALNDIVSFINQPCGSDEIIILKFSHFAHLDTYGPDPMTSSEYMEIVSQVQTILEPYLYANTTSSINLNQQTMASLKTKPGATVIALFDVGNKKAEGYFFPTDQIATAQGIFAFGDTAIAKVSYPIAPNFLLYDSYANSNNFSTMVTDQQKKLSAFKKDPQKSFLLSWTLTCQGQPCTGGTVGKKTNISCLATMAQYTNPQLSGTVLSWVSHGTIKSGRMPNILYVDYCGQFADDSVAVAAELNGKFS
jgi:hypothetical protein